MFFSSVRMKAVISVLGCVLSVVLVPALAEPASRENLDPMLVTYSRSSLNLSLCSVVFSEEFENQDLADRYQHGNERAEALIARGNWSQDDVLLAHELVLREEFSFQLTPDESWGEFRREYFTRPFCEEALAVISQAD